MVMQEFHHTHLLHRYTGIQLLLCLGPCMQLDHQWDARHRVDRQALECGLRLGVHVQHKRAVAER